MIAQNNEILTSATKSLFEYNADDLIRQQCRAREEAERHERTLLKKISDSEKTIAAQADTINKQAGTIDELKKENQTLKADIQELSSIVHSLQAQLKPNTN